MRIDELIVNQIVQALPIFIGVWKPVIAFTSLYDDRSTWRRWCRNNVHPVSCIYVLVNSLDTTKFYVGQTVNLLGRMNNYLNHAYLALKANCNMPIVKAISKHGASNFHLVVLEIVPVDNLNGAEIK